ncbi:MAG: S-layer homology domain-containing protein, partial [Woeseia sp.]|nr:S-layer homology domain-containing protein [Woeseia sp.]
NDGVPDGEDDFPLGQFTDVRPDYWAFTFVEALARAGITAGCGGGNYCPLAPVTRSQMAVFLERGMNGSGFVPPAATGTVFSDVGAGDFAANFIEQLAGDGITAGCGNNNYCPNSDVTRDQMAVFLLRAKYGAAYSPPAATGVFTDVPPGRFAAAWIEKLAADGITSGCGGGNYCPDAQVTRDQMAVFLVRTFGL